MRNLLVLPFLGLLWAAACVQDSIQPEPTASGGSSVAGSPGASPAGAGGSSLNGGAGGEGSTSSKAGQAGSIQEGGQAGQGGTELTSWECTKAKGLPGAPMVRVETPNGKSYCMDIREVNQKEYAEFYEAIKSSDLAKNPGVLHPDCKDNQFYPKVGTWEAACDQAGYSYTPEKYPESPVGCVDWCDAKAYCKWAGKRLCGRVGGGNVTKDTLGNANEDQWYNVCSMGGKSKYAIGNAYKEGQCLDKSRYQGDSSMTFEQALELLEKKYAASIQDFPDCHGTEAPFDQIYHINGSRAELTDAYDVYGAIQPCLLRGGFFGSGSEDFECTRWAWFSKTDSAPAVGFRCCLDDQE